MKYCATNNEPEKVEQPTKEQVTIVACSDYQDSEGNIYSGL